MEMTDTEAVFFRQSLRQCRHYLEYGAGGSTLAAVETPAVVRATSVESDPEFFRTRVLIHDAIRQALTDQRLTVHEIDIGPTDAWGMPKDKSKKARWPDYSASPYRDPDCRPDLILIDGRFRVAGCMMAALKAPRATILVHDYNARPVYRIVEDFFEIEKRVDSFAQLRRRSAAKDADIQRVWQRYAHSPDDQPVSPWDRARTLRWRAQHWLNKRKLGQL